MMGTGAEVLVPEVRLAVASTCTAGDARVTLGPTAVRALGVQLGDPVAVDVRWGKLEGDGDEGGGDGMAADEWTWTFLVRCPLYGAPSPHAQARELLTRRFLP